MHAKDIKSLVRLMRTQGITHLSTPEYTITLGEAPIKAPRALKQPVNNTPGATTSSPTTPELSEEDILFWSSGHVPENN